MTRFISYWQLDINFHGTSTKTFPFLVFTFISSSRTLVRVIVMELINHFTGRRMKSFILLPVIKLYWDIRHFSIAKQIIKLKRHKELVNFNSFFIISNLVNINGTTLVGDNLKQEGLWWVAALVRPGLVKGNRGTIQGTVDDLLKTSLRNKGNARWSVKYIFINIKINIKFTHYQLHPGSSVAVVWTLVGKGPCPDTMTLGKGERTGDSASTSLTC